MGSNRPIRLQTIILIQSRKDYKYFIKVLYAVGSITDEGLSVLDVDRKDTSNHIEHLFEYRLGMKIDEKMDKYVYEMFDAYCKNKKRIGISMPIFDQLKHSPYKPFIHSYEYDKDVYLRGDTDKTNLLRPELAKIFPNVIKVHIDASYCSFSLIAFLSILKISNWQRIEIYANWVPKLEKSSKWPLIVKQYESNNYKMEIDKYDNIHIHAHHP